jgi:hypothetical protein
MLQLLHASAAGSFRHGANTPSTFLSVFAQSVRLKKADMLGMLTAILE